MNEIIKTIKDKFGDVVTIWKLGYIYIIFKNYGDDEGIYYDSKTGESRKDKVDCMALSESADLVYTKEEKYERVD